jgi:peptidoglycan hydrolase-like protein with peptidoglycan-binding domain
MAFTFLLNGDVLPSVTTSQILLRRHRPQAVITADGIFGPRTKRAVEGFQSFHSLDHDGIIGDHSWNQFMTVSGFQTIDVVDGTDPSLVALEANDIRSAGGNPIVVFGMSNGIEFVSRQIVARGRPGNVMLLRFHGHGNRGLQNVTGGTIDGAPHLAAISLSNYSQIEPIIAPIKTVMLKFGSIQLLGCDVGGGRGSQLVSRLAGTWGAPVTAGLHTQFGGGSATFRFEGPTVTGFPGFASLRAWSQAMEAQFGNQTMTT